MENVDSNTIYHIHKQFQKESGQLNQDDSEECSTEIREFYKWRHIELNKTLKKAGIMTGTGISIGLKRSGNNIINAVYKPKQLKPSIPVKSELWVEIKDIAKKTT